MIGPDHCRLLCPPRRLCFRRRLSVCFACLLAGLRKHYLTDFHRIHWKGGTPRPEKKQLDSVRNPDAVTIGIVMWDTAVECTLHGRLVL